MKLTTFPLDIHILILNHEPLSKIGIAMRFINLKSHEPKRILTINTQTSVSALIHKTRQTQQTYRPASTRGTITVITSLRNTLIKEVFRNGPAPGFFLDKVELETLCCVLSVTGFAVESGGAELDERRSCRWPIRLGYHR
jgi:hypothetical protein